MSDTSLRQDIVDELEFEPSIDAANVGVAVDRGIVILTGHVPTYGQKVTAEAVVRKVRGVKGIAEEIEVRPEGTNRAADDEIARRAINTIEWNTVVPNGAVQATVQHGRVTLRGKVEWQYQRAAAAEAVKSLHGVRGITNLIEVAPRAFSGDVKKRIEEALKRDAELEAKGISVDVLDGKVVLEGKVHSWSERYKVENAAWSAPGVKAVVDHLQVG